MAIKLVIFDVDGVMFDSEKAHVAAWEKVAARRNFSFSAADYEAGFGVCDREFLIDMRRQGKIPEDQSLKEILKEKIKFLLELADQPLPVYSDTKEAIAGLYGKFPMVAASNSDRSFVLKVLKQADLLPFFNFVVTRADINKPKPSPEIYFLCARKAGFKPEECLVIEDSPVGVAAAKNAGMPCIAVTHTVPPERLQAADLIVEQLCPEVINRFVSGL